MNIKSHSHIFLSSLFYFEIRLFAIRDAINYQLERFSQYMSEYQMISLSLLEDRSYHNTMTSSNQFDESREVYQPSGPSGASMIDGIKHEDVKK